MRHGYTHLSCILHASVEPSCKGPRWVLDGRFLRPLSRTLTHVTASWTAPYSTSDSWLWWTTAVPLCAVETTNRACVAQPPRRSVRCGVFGRRREGFALPAGLRSQAVSSRRCRRTRSSGPHPTQPPVSSARACLIISTDHIPQTMTSELRSPVVMLSVASVIERHMEPNMPAAAAQAK